MHLVIISVTQYWSQSRWPCDIAAHIDWTTLCTNAHLIRTLNDSSVMQSSRQSYSEWPNYKTAKPLLYTVYRTGNWNTFTNFLFLPMESSIFIVMFACWCRDVINMCTSELNSKLEFVFVGFGCLFCFLLLVFTVLSFSTLMANEHVYEYKISRKQEC